MFVSHIDEIPPQEVQMDGVKEAFKQILIGPKQGWEGHVMRRFTLSAGGYTPRHSHSWPHINYITDGEGSLFLSGKSYPLSRGSVAFIPGGEEHQFSNPTGADFSFICIIPDIKEK